MILINIFSIEELIYQLNLIKNKEKYNYLCHNDGEFGWVIIILHLIRKYILNSKKNGYKVICFCIDGQEILYNGMNIDILFVFNRDTNNTSNLKKNILNNKSIQQSNTGEIKISDMSFVINYLYSYNIYLNENNYKSIIEKQNFNDIFYNINNSKNELQNSSYFNSNIFKVSKKIEYKKDISHVSDIMITDKDFLLKTLYITNDKFIENKHVTFIIRNSYKWKQRDLCLKKMFKLIDIYLKLNYNIIVIQDIIPVKIPNNKNINNITLPNLNWKKLFDKICNSEKIYGAYSGLMEAIIYKLNCDIGMLLRDDIGKHKPSNELIKRWVDFQNLKNKSFTIK